MTLLGPRLPAHWQAPAGIAALLLLALLCNRFSDLDLWLTGLFYQPGQGFGWKDHWLAVGLLHDGARRVSAAIALLLAGTLAWGTWVPGSRWRVARAPLGFTLVTGLLAAWGVAALKHASVHSCPWDLSLFGGTADYFRLFAPLPAHPGPGQCLPSGHASTGFMWIGAAYAAARWPRVTPWAADARWRWAWGGFAVASTAVQVVRGAHFLSHLLIAVAVCWGVAWVLDVACAQVLRRRPATAMALRPLLRAGPGSAPARAGRRLARRAASPRRGAASRRP